MKKIESDSLLTLFLKSMDSLQFIWTSERIDTYLTKQFSYSRNFFHHIISRWGVKVNNKIIKKSYKLKNNDQIFIDDLKRYFWSEVLAETPNIDIPIVLEKEDYMIINKPKWVLSHPKTVWEVNDPSVVWFLYHKFKSLPSIWDFIRAGIIHRLDRWTNGLMIIAKTEKWLQHFKKLFQNKSESQSLEDKENTPLKKFYRATSYITEKWQEFLNKIENDLPHYIEEIVAAKVPHNIPKQWITKILWLNNNIVVETPFMASNKEVKNPKTIWLEMEILTWRTHQIRYHLSSKWLPIVWDWLYWFEDGNEVQLTAYKLMFQDLDGKMITVEI